MRTASKTWTFIWLFVAGLIVMSCLQDDVEHVDAMDIQADSALLSLHTVKITLLDSNQNELQVLYNDSVISLSDLSRLRLTTPYRGRASIRIEGWKDGKPAYLEIRGFDLASQNLLDAKVVFHPAAGISRPPVLSGLPASAEVKAGDTLKVSATAVDIDGPLASYAWTFAGGATPDLSGGLADSTATITGFHVYAVAGEYLAILAVSDSMSTVRGTVVVSVKAKDGSPPLEADAGADATVGTDSLVRLTPKAKGGSGPVAGYAWKSGDGEFSAASLPGDTSFTMPSQPGTFTVLLKATDSSGQIDLDSVVFTVIASANANLAVLKIGGAELDPLFKPATELYTASVPFGISKINMGAITQHKAATIKLGSRYIGAADSAEVSLAVGDNTIEAVVLSQSGVQKKYQVTVTRRKNTETRLAGLEVSVGTLSPKFHPDTSEYTIAVTNEVASVNLKALAMDSTGATLRLAPEGSDTVPLLARTPSSPQALEVGTRAFQVWVIAQDGAARRSYRVAITRQASPNATLLSLVPSVGTLKPSFLPNVSEYFDTVSNAQAGLLLRAVPTSDKAKLYQAGSEVAPGADGPVATLPVGDTTMSILVRAETGDTNTYRVRVHRKSTDATLKGLTTSVPGLPNGFATGTESYSDTVGADVASLTVTPVPNHQQAKAQVASPVTLKDGANPIAVTVTAEDGNTLTYTMNVYRISGNARLATVEASAGDWGTLFKPDVFSYKDTVPESVGKVSIRATVTSGKSKIQIQGKAVASGAWSDSVTLVEGMQTLKVKVVAESGDSAEYSLSLYRTSGNAQLNSLFISPGSLSPVFSGNVTQYTDTVPSSAASIVVAATCGSARGSIVKVGTKLVSANSINESVNISTGANTIPITVRSEQGNEAVYVLQIHRQNSNASLSKLVPSSGILRPVFSAAVSQYQDTVENHRLTFSLTPTAAMATAKIKVAGSDVVSGQASKPISMALGMNTVKVVVTAEDPAVESTYTVNVYRYSSFSRYYGGIGSSGGTSGMQLPDSSFILVGYGQEQAPRSGNDLYIMKTNQYGDSLWLKAFGWPGYDIVWDVKQTKDGGYVMAGATDNVEATQKAMIARTNAQGDTLWARHFGGTMRREAKAVIQTADGGFLFTGAVGISQYYYSLLISKVNADGSLAWEKTYHPEPYYSSNGEDIIATPDGGFAVIGRVQGIMDKAYMLKLNSAGDTVWSRIYSGKAHLNAESIANAPGGGFMIAGCENFQSSSQQVYFIRTDADGKETLSKAIAGTEFGSAYSIKPSKDGAFIVTGYRGSANGSIPFLMKIDVNGNISLDTVPTKNGTGGAWYAQDILGGGYLVIGTWGIFLTKTDPSGTLR